MSISRFARTPDEKPFHSSAYAKVARGARIGSTTPQPFSERTRIEKNRRAVASYRDSYVATHQIAYADRRNRPFRPQPHQSEAIGTPETPTQPSKGPEPRQPEPPRPSFQEPTPRGYNPYS